MTDMHLRTFKLTTSSEQKNKEDLFGLSIMCS